MEVLSSETIYKMNPIFEQTIVFGAATILLGLIFLILLAFLAEYYDWPFFVGMTIFILGTVTTVGSLILGECFWKVEDYTKQEVIFEESIPLEFFDSYEILEQRGEIFVIREKEN